MEKGVNLVIGIFGAFFCFCFGTDNSIIDMLLVLLFLMFGDILFGIINAINSKTFKMAEVRRGLFKKVSTLFMVAIAYQIDKIGILADTIFLEKTVLSIFIGYEIVSILHNIKIQGVTIPAILWDLIKKFTGKDAGQDGK